jgi:hypothetical protein
MITNTSSSIESPATTSKLSFLNTSTGIINSNSVGNINSRYSPSNFYRAAAVAAVTSDPNNRRYMPNTPVSKTVFILKKKVFFLV